MPYNSDSFDLSNWKLTIPRDGADSNTHADDIQNLRNYESEFFYRAADGGMVFYADTDGATTSGSKYARSELREMNGSAVAKWSLAEGGTMSATLKIDALPTNNNHTPGKFVIGQIHGKSDELVRLYYDSGQIYFKNDQVGPQNKEQRFDFKDANGNTPQVAMGEKFSYAIDAHGSTLTVKIYADGNVYTSVTTISSAWNADEFYFKAGVYLGVNETNGSGSGQATFYGLDFSHTAGEGLKGVVLPVTAVSYEKASGAVQIDLANPSLDNSAANTLNHTGADHVVGSAYSDDLRGDSGANRLRGGKGHDTLLGRDGNDALQGDTGNDMLYGQGGNDVLQGGDGNDRLFGGAGSDVLTGGKGADSFIYRAISESAGRNFDIISDFKVGVDKIDLHGLNFKRFDTDGGRTEAGELRIVYNGTSDRTYLVSDQTGFKLALVGDLHLVLTHHSIKF